MHLRNQTVTDPIAKHFSVRKFSLNFSTLELLAPIEEAMLKLILLLITLAACLSAIQAEKSARIAVVGAGEMSFVYLHVPFPQIMLLFPLSRRWRDRVGVFH